MKDLLFKGKIATKSKFNLKVKQVALYDYILEDWKLPSIKELKSEVKSSGKMNIEYFTKNTEKELKRRSEIQKITKTTMRRSTRKRNPTMAQSKMRRSTVGPEKGSVGIENSQQEPDEDPDEFMTAYDEEMKSQNPSGDIEKSISDSQSFKSFNMNMDNPEGSVVSSIHESQFGDALDETDYWKLNHDHQHFSLIPILTINSFKSIGKSIKSRYDSMKLSSSVISSREGKGNQALLDSDDNQEETNFHLPHHYIDSENLLFESEDESDEEQEVRLGGIKPSTRRETEIQNSIEVTVDIQKHRLKKRNKNVSLVDVNIRTQNIFVELTP